MVLEMKLVNKTTLLIPASLPHKIPLTGTGDVGRPRVVLNALVVTPSLPRVGILAIHLIGYGKVAILSHWSDRWRWKHQIVPQILHAEAPTLVGGLQLSSILRLHELLLLQLEHASIELFLLLLLTLLNILLPSTEITQKVSKI